MPKMLLKVENLSMSFGGLKALSGCNFEIEKGELRGLIGPNGSGKSTFFNVISGIYKPDKGSRIWFDNAEITNRQPHEIAARGVARTFQLMRLFAEMTVLENVLVGYHSLIPYSRPAAAFGLRRVWNAEKRVKDEMMELLSFIGLADFAELPASELSGGQRRLLALGRAMAMKPKLLMLDEPASGLSPVNVDNILNIMMAMKEKYGLTVIVIEHILKVVMETCDRVTVLDHGQKISEGRPDQVKEDPKVIEAYLGKEMDDNEIRAAMGVLDARAPEVGYP